MTTVVWVAGFYVVDAWLRGGGLFFRARRRDERRRVWWQVSVIPVAFLGLVAVVVAIVRGSTSLARHAEIEFFAAGSTKGLVTAHIEIHSSGRQDHQIQIAGKRPLAFVSEQGSRYSYWRCPDVREGEAVPLRRRADGDSDVQVSIGPWRTGHLVVFDEATLEEPLTGSAELTLGAGAAQRSRPADVPVTPCLRGHRVLSTRRSC